VQLFKINGIYNPTILPKNSITELQIPIICSPNYKFGEAEVVGAAIRNLQFRIKINGICNPIFLPKTSIAELQIPYICSPNYKFGEA
jgi:hypothetical protein